MADCTIKICTKQVGEAAYSACKTVRRNAAVDISDKVVLDSLIHANTMLA